MQHSGLLRRLGAMLYDSLLVLALLFLITIPFIAVRGGQPVAADGNRIYQVTLLLVIYAFFTGFWSTAGRTLGMQSWGLRLETPDGKVPSMRAATIRFCAAILSWLPLGLGFLWQLWDKDNLTWHDRLSHTRLAYYPKPDKQSKPD
ncbi:MAG: RDD family protein [Gammaproteobacteria bacterium]|nr:RDD family protein [Gammaproteobacteria bacterium]